jgi:putative transposase
VKVRAILDLKAAHRLSLLLEVAGLARSTFFYHQARLTRPDAHAELDEAIQAAFSRAKGRYGHRRVHRELVKAGWRVAKKTVLKRMGARGLICQIRRKRPFSTYRGELGGTAPNVLNRSFTTAAPNQAWVTDITQFRIGQETLYLSPVMDLFDRQIIAYTTGRSPNVALVTGSLRAAIETIAPDEHPLVHSDQGVQYQHAAWRALLTEAGATPSMSRKGTCLDNAVIESFFGHLKTELAADHRGTSRDDLTRAIADYIAWYNQERTSARLKGLSPVQYRAQALVT